MNNWLDLLSLALSLAAILLTALFVSFNIKFRQYKLIKMSSPNINHIINFACILIYFTPIMNSVKDLAMPMGNEPLAASMCHLNAWIIPTSSSLIYSCMLLKAWRIYKIFETSSRVKKVIIKDHQLIFYILCLAIFDVVLLIFWQFYDPIEIRPRHVLVSKQDRLVPVNMNSHSNESFSGDNSTVLVQNMSFNSELKTLYECGSTYAEVWIAVLTIYKIILFMYGIYLAWLIRTINVPSMNDSMYLIVSTFVIIVSGLGSMSLMQILRDWPEVVKALFTIGVIGSTCTTQCLIFIPKIQLWYRQKNDEHFKISFSHILLQSSTSCNLNKRGKSGDGKKNDGGINLEEELCMLIYENNQLRGYLRQKDDIIQLLQSKVRTAKQKLVSQLQESSTKIKPSVISLPLPSDNNKKDGCPESQDNKSVEFTQLVSSHNTFKLSTKHDSGFEADSSTTTHSTLETFGNKSIGGSTGARTMNTLKTEQLKNDLEEVEELTSRVRDSISIDLCNTRRYSPLLYEYYRKQLELAKSIQYTYNIQCGSSSSGQNDLASNLFDAHLTLMRKCLTEHAQTVHNPEYLAVEELQNSKEGNKSSPFSEYLAKQSQMSKNVMQRESVDGEQVWYTSTMLDNETPKVEQESTNSSCSLVSSNHFASENSSSGHSSTESKRPIVAIQALNNNQTYV